MKSGKWYLSYTPTHPAVKENPKEVDLESSKEEDAQSEARGMWMRCHKNFGRNPQLVYISHLKID